MLIPCIAGCTVEGMIVAPARPGDDTAIDEVDPDTSEDMGFEDLVGRWRVNGVLDASQWQDNHWFCYGWTPSTPALRDAELIWTDTGEPATCWTVAINEECEQWVWFQPSGTILHEFTFMPDEDCEGNRDRTVRGTRAYGRWEYLSTEYTIHDSDPYYCIG